MYKVSQEKCGAFHRPYFGDKQIRLGAGCVAILFCRRKIELVLEIYFVRIGPFFPHLQYLHFVKCYFDKNDHWFKSLSACDN